MAQAKEGEGLREDGLSSSAGASRINFISIENLNLFRCKCLFVYIIVRTQYAVRMRPHLCHRLSDFVC